MFTKVGTNYITVVAHNFIRLFQTTFMPWRHILEGVVVLHETTHKLALKKYDEALLKVNFEKVYNKIWYNSNKCCS